MKFIVLLSTLLISALTLLPARGQAARQAALARQVYHLVNTPPASLALKAAVARQTDDLFGDGRFQPGALRTFDGRRRPVPGLRYHVERQLLEAQDSITPDVTHLWPVSSLRGFDLDRAGDGAAPRRFRPRLVRECAVGCVRRDFVEVLTTLDSGPLLLGWLFLPLPADEEGPARLMQVLVAGPGPATNPDGLRPLELTREAVLRLFGARAEQVRSFAAGQRLHFSRPADVARMVDYFNHVALVKVSMR